MNDDNTPHEHSRESRKESTLFTDPVCGMRINPETARARRRYQDRDWWFCSTDCAHQFTTTPSTYTSTLPVTASERQPT